MRGSSARALVPALVVLGSLAVVAIASTGSTSSGTGRTRRPADTLLDTILTLGLVAVVAGGILVAYGLMQRKEIAAQVASGRYPRTSIVGWLLFVAAFTAFAYWRLGLWKPKQASPGVSDAFPPNRIPPPGGTPADPNANTYEPHIAWLAVALVLLLVAGAVVAYVVSGRRARRHVSERVSLAEDVAAVLDETLDDLRAEPDPRRAVIAAYARLERVLAANGLPRRDAETPEEYLPRFLLSLEVSDAAARRLTDLFEWAKFSPHSVDGEMKEEAIGALEQLRDELRTAREASEAVLPSALATGRASP